MALVATGSAQRSSFGDLLEPGFREIFFEQYAQLPSMYDKIFHVADSSRQQEYDSSISGFGTLVETSEGAAVTYEEPIQGLGTIVVLVKLGKLLENLKAIVTSYVTTLWMKQWAISRQNLLLTSDG